MKLTGSVVIVTGAAGGIGSATCRRLAGEGAAICAVDRDPAALSSLLSDLPGAGHVASAVDLADLAAHAEVLQRAASTSKPLAGLVHLAAVLLRRADLDDVTEQDWDTQLDTNLKATFFLDRAVAQALIAQGDGGAIVNFSSQGWWTGGFGGSVVYAASKGGVVSMTRGLARTLAPHKIRVNVVAPGFIDTPMMSEGLSDEQLAALIDQVPLGRLAEPDEIADAALYLISDQSRYVTGATLNVSGGQLMY